MTPHPHSIQPSIPQTEPAPQPSFSQPPPQRALPLPRPPRLPPDAPAPHSPAPPAAAAPAAPTPPTPAFAPIDRLTGALLAPNRTAGPRGHSDDLRRRTPIAVAQRLVACAAALPLHDRRLVEAVYGEGRSVCDIAHAAGVSPRPLRSRLKHLRRRLLEPVFAFAAARAATFPSPMRHIVTLLVFEGRSVRDTARRLGLTYHHVRLARDELIVRAREAEQQRAAAARALRARPPRDLPDPPPDPQPDPLEDEP